MTPHTADELRAEFLDALNRSSLGDARGEIKVRVTVPTTTGWKAIALSAGARQELFVSTALTKIEVEVAFDRALEGY